MTPPLASVIGVGVLAVVIAARRRLGPHTDWVEALRAYSLPALDRLLEHRFGGPGSAYQLGQREFVTAVGSSPEAVEHRLWNEGCRRNLLAAFKTGPNGEEADGSWAYRGAPLSAHRQVHVMLFKRDDGGTDIYAHHEHSSAVSWLWRNPTVLYKHYRGVGYSPAEGEQFVREHILPIE